MNKQEIFDAVTAHLRMMTKPSINDGTGCAYRGIGGAKCAIGCLIPDEMYSTDMEGQSVRLLMQNKDQFGYKLPDFFNDENGELMGTLQNYVHDEYARLVFRKERDEETYESFADFMEPRLKEIAEEFELKYLEPVT